MGRPKKRLADPTTFNGKLGINIRNSRERIGLSVADLSAAIGVSRTQLHVVESGLACPSALVVAKIQHAIGVDVMPKHF